MEAQKIIYEKLTLFIRKYHFNQLVKGILLFLSIGLIYFLATVFIEYFLWLSVTGRTILFSLFILTESYLFIRFILVPLLRLFKLRKGLDFVSASIIIGNHFPEVADKLINFLQLTKMESSVSFSELIQASIEQKAVGLKWVPFESVITYKNHYKLLPLALIPLLFVLYLFFIPSQPLLKDSYQRFVQFNKPFTPPPPFQFKIINTSLKVKQGDDFVLDIKVFGKVLPSDCKVIYDNQEYFAEQISPSQYKFVFKHVNKDIPFVLSANNLFSDNFILSTVKVPTILSFKMRLDYPEYLNKKSEYIDGTGNAVVPEGTKIRWEISSVATQAISFKTSNSSFNFLNNNPFVLSKIINDNIDYQIVTSNNNYKNHEILDYQIKVVKDQFPSISFNVLPDSLKLANSAHYGQVSDDYGLHKLQVVFYPNIQPELKKQISIPVKKALFDQFYFNLSEHVKLTEGVTYDYYFQVFDNDVLNSYKMVKSTVFTTRMQTNEEKVSESFKKQEQSINALSNTIRSNTKQQNELEKLKNLSKEKSSLEYKDQLKFQDFVNKQKSQDEMMNKFANELKQNLKEFEPKQPDALKDELLKRLDNQNKELSKNEEILKELQDLNDKLDQQDLKDKLDKLKHQSQKQTKSLQQLLELTKKFYVEKKLEQVSKQLDNLSKEQKDLSEQSSPQEIKEQQDLKIKFDDIKKELNDAREKNKSLQSPMSIPDNKSLENQISDEMNKAEQHLKEQKQSKAKSYQQNASKKMKEMSKSLQESMEQGEMEQLEEDVQVLRQIMDNLLTFSYSQEKLLNEFKVSKRGAPNLAKNIKKQQFLRTQFKFVDDSLFTLSVRNPMIGDKVFKALSDSHYHLDKSLEYLSDTQLDKGAMHQQYVITYSNTLADFLSDALSNMQMQMQMSSSGKGKPKPGNSSGDMQLPDIIKQQKGVSEKLQKGLGKSPSSQLGENGSQKQEGMSGEMFEIYKQQQMLREALEKAMQQGGNNNSGKQALEQMKQLEKQLLNKAFTQQNIQKSMSIQQELLKLEKAMKLQGEEDKRQAESPTKNQFSNSNSALPQYLKEYFQTTEFLQRHQLPLQRNYQIKIKNYFNKND